MNQASHYVDQLDWLIGPVESVMAYTGTLARRIEVEDTGVAALKWRNGAMGSIMLTMLICPKNVEGSLAIIGENGSVRTGSVAVSEIQNWELARPDPMDTASTDASYETTSVEGYGYAPYCDNVIRTLRDECEPETDGHEGLKSLEMLIAIYLSARDGKLERFESELAQRHARGACYLELVSRVESVKALTVRPDRDCVWAQVSVFVERRDAVREALVARGIPTAVHYPKPLHHQPAFARYGCRYC